MTLERFTDVSAFLDRTGPWLGEREAEHNLIFGVLGTIQEMPDAFGEEPPYLAAVGGPVGRPLAVAMRTPPWHLVLSEVDVPAALAALADDAASTYPDLDGVVGPKEEVAELAQLLGRRLGRRPRLDTSERAFRLRQVRPPRMPPGRPRLAGPGDRALALRWLTEFEREARGETRPPSAAAEARLDAGLARRGSRLVWLWEDVEPVSITWVGGPTPNGIRVGPVYTPPEFRAQGYASALVATASQAALDSGRTFVFLFTDLANPTANHIYQAIGYEPVRDVDEWVFEAGPVT
jgi:uncharacterized protein